MSKDISKGNKWWQGWIPRGHCKHCGRPIFNKESKWAKVGKCIYCYEAEERGKRKR